MNKKRLVTRKQAEKLKELGFKEKVCHYQMSDLSVGVSYPRDWNNEAVPYGLDNIVNYPYLSIPTVDEAIEWLINKLDKRQEFFYYDVKKDTEFLSEKITYYCTIDVLDNLERTFTKKRNSIYSAKKDLINKLIKMIKLYQK
jgi:hypothetical protein